MSDLAAFRLRLAAVVNDALAGRVPAAEDALALADQARELLQELHDRRCMRRLQTRELIAQFRRLESALRDRSPAERRTAVCRRLGIGRSRYFELRRAVQSSPFAD